MGWLNRVVSGVGDRLTTPAGSDTGPPDLLEQRPQILMLQEGRLHPVVGEASYQKALHRLGGRLGTEGPSESRRWHIADLVPEPTNPHDPNAIAVTVGGQHVGYIA